MFVFFQADASGQADKPFNGTTKSKLAQPEEFRPAVLSVVPYKPINDLFAQTKGWVGADGAYSIPLSKGKTLWTFGDTFIGAIKGKKRVAAKMINNSVGIQNHGGKAGKSIDFYWAGSMDKPVSVWTVKGGKDYYWPGDGACIEDKLFVFLHKIRTNLKLPPPFQFETRGDDLVVVSNPLESPQKWKMKTVVLSDDSKTINWATACMQAGEYLYIYSNYPIARAKFNPHPVIVSRIKKKSLLQLNFDDMEYFSDKSTWVKKLDSPRILFMDGAPEMSVSAVKGINGYIALYMAPLTKRLYIRHSERPEGPWSKATLLYECPEQEDNILLYSAKLHQELVDEKALPGTLIVTYCRNLKNFSDHFERPRIYFPKAVKIELKVSN